MISKSVKFLALIMAAVLFVSLAACAQNETSEEEVKEPSKTALPSGETEILDYFNKMMAGLSSLDYSVKYSSGYSPRGFSCEGNETLAAGLPTVVKLMNFNDGLGGEYSQEDQSAMRDFFNDILPAKNSETVLQLTPDDLARDEDGKLIIDINAEAFEKQQEEEERAKQDKNYEIQEVDTDPDTRVITLTLADEENPVQQQGLFGKIFQLPDKDKIADEFKKCEDYLIYEGEYTCKYTGCTVRMEIDRLTDEVIKLEFGRNIEVSATVRGSGTLESVGRQTITFTVGGSDVYEFIREEK